MSADLWFVRAGDAAEVRQHVCGLLSDDFEEGMGLCSDGDLELLSEPLYICSIAMS